jgi:hypothetical protein
MVGMGCLAALQQIKKSKEQQFDIKVGQLLS